MIRTLLTVAVTLALPASAQASIASTNPPAPSVTYITEHEGKAGASVTIVGSGFTSVTGVRFGTVPAPFRVLSPLELTTTTPPGSGTVDVTAEGSEGSSALVWADRWSYEVVPVSLPVVAPVAVASQTSAANLIANPPAVLPPAVAARPQRTINVFCCNGRYVKRRHHHKRRRHRR